MHLHTYVIGIFFVGMYETTTTVSLREGKGKATLLLSLIPLFPPKNECEKMPKAQALLALPAHLHNLDF